MGAAECGCAGRNEGWHGTASASRCQKPSVRRRLCAILAANAGKHAAETAQHAYVDATRLPGRLQAAAQDYPNRTIKFVVPFPAGGPADTIARILTDKMASLIGQNMVVENRAGAGGLTGIAAVA